MNKHTCNCTIHPDTIENVKDCMCEDTIEKMSDFLKVLAVPSRLRIANALLISEMCVCDLAALLCMEHSAISHQLAILRKADVVKTRKAGKVIYYSLSDEHISLLIDVTKAHVLE